MIERKIKYIIHLKGENNNTLTSIPTSIVATNEQIKEIITTWDTIGKFYPLETENGVLAIPMSDIKYIMFEEVK